MIIYIHHARLILVDCVDKVTEGCYHRHLVKNEAIHRASPVYSQMGYIGTGLALCIAGERIFLHRASPVYSQMRYNWHRASQYTPI